MGDRDVDVDVDNSFSKFPPGRLSGIIDLSLVSMVNDKRVEVIEEDGPPSNSSQTWTEILNGDLEHGFGIFHTSVSAYAFDHAAYYLFVKRRQGIIRVHNERGKPVVRNSPIHHPPAQKPKRKPKTMAAPSAH